MPHPHNTVSTLPASRSTAVALMRTTAPTTAPRPAVCAHPIRLVGERYLVNSRTGLLLDHSGEAEITVNCGNRRATVCPHCSTLYQYDTYQLIAAGLRGGKGILPTVGRHPRLFVTLTAPSFGPVHQGPDKKSGRTRPCTPRRDGTGCFRHHRTGDRIIGSPITPETYDYPGHVLFNAHAAILWSCTLTEVRRALARLLGVTRRTLHHHVTVQFAKVAEYQARGIVHFHAIARLDGPTGPSSPPPAQATASLLEQAIREAVEHTAIPIPPVPDLGIGARDIRWGDQIDIRPIRAGDNGDSRTISDAAVARYIAKYATKSAESAGIQLPPLACRQCRGTGHLPGPLLDQIRRCRACRGTGAGVDLSA